VRDEILERSEPLDAATLLDLGTGDGLIGLAALDRVGPCGNVIFCDISEALLDQCREAVDDRSLTGRAQLSTRRPRTSPASLTTRSTSL